ncbi:hypothetical protein PUR57_02225 [Streptomyces sp. JV176]|uniref:hypothetical protein n=1 Tax=Streptomyces sp. JV176 TaxID=858630 RepID=UPI002E79343B|nr:hypothetical protein [Streptomyces sp. JV176]MEE1797512.1 hypothetical protein [Streptomyces sp. JV176]
MTVRTEAPNGQLDSYLKLLRWSPARLAHVINTLLGPGYVARTTVADWIAKGRIPRDPLPTVTAHVLAEALGRPVPLNHLWGPGMRRSSSTWVRADDGLPPPTAPGATVETATQWVIQDGGDMDRRTFLAISGAAFTGPAFTDTAAAHASSVPTTTSLRDSVVTPAIADALGATVDAIRHLDDVEGGDHSTLRHARRQFTGVADYVRANHYTDAATRTRTISLWAQLAQSVGWMAMDAGLHGLAQRYFLTGLTAAHESGDPGLVSHIHGCLTYQAITLGRLRDAIDLANAGIATARNAPPAVRALAAARHAHAHAALGDIHGLRQSTTEARRHLDHPEALDSRPPWLYWLTDLSVVTGQSLIVAAFAGNSADPHRAALLTEADPLITGWLGTHAERTEDRDALLHGTWLARSYLRRDDVEQTLNTATSLLQYASTVRSAQVRSILLDLEGDLAQRRDLRTHRNVLQLRADLKDVTDA